MGLRGQSVTLPQSGVHLRIRILTGLEVPIRFFLRLHNTDIDSGSAEDGAHRHITRTAQGRIQEIQVVGRNVREAFPENRLIVTLPQLVGDILDAPLPQALFKGQLGLDKIRRFGNRTKYAGRRLVGHLAAVGAVAFDAVIHACVVAGGDNNARAAAKLPHRKRDHRCRRKHAVDIDVNSRLRKRNRANLRKTAGVMPGIITDGAFLRQLRSGQPRGETLCGTAHRKGIHAVRAEAHNTADTARAELQLGAEAAFDLVFISGQLLQGSEIALAKRRSLTPNLVAF